jgi:Ras-related C3 botulinum toxin substrate 1
MCYKLSGTKIDLREEDPECISFAEGKKLKQKIRAARYVECSAIKGEGLQDVFTEAIRAVMKKPPTVRRTCSFF